MFDLSFVLLANRLCLEVERLGLSAVIMGSRGFGATKRDNSGRLGSVSDYCVRHCVCPVVVVRYPEEKDGGGGAEPVVSVASAVEDEEEEEPEYHDATDHRKGSGFPSVLHESFLLNMIILCYVCIDVYLQLKNLTLLVNPVSD